MEENNYENDIRYVLGYNACFGDLLNYVTDYMKEHEKTEIGIIHLKNIMTKKYESVKEKVK